jgi:hypothetical protein
VKRYAPEDRVGGSAGPLFDQTPVEKSRQRGHDASRAAGARAEKIDPDWRRASIAMVEEHCRTHERFVAEAVGIEVPPGADPRCVGHVMRDAARIGICVADGFAPTVSSRGSPKVSWRSLIYGGASNG